MEELVIKKFNSILETYKPSARYNNRALIANKLQAYFYNEVGVSNEKLWTLIDRVVEKVEE